VWRLEGEASFSLERRCFVGGERILGSPQHKTNRPGGRFPGRAPKVLLTFGGVFH